jgi:hypothetical protein
MCVVFALNNSLLSSDPSCTHLLVIMSQISDAQHAALAGLLKTVGPSADGHKVLPYEVEDDVQGEQETLPDNEGPSQILDVLNTVGEVSTAVKDRTDGEYRR